MSIPLRQTEEAIILLATQGRCPSLPTEVACPLTHLRLRRPLLLRDDQRILTVAMASETAMGWSITMRNTEPVLTASRATMTGVPVPSPLLRLLLRRWLENVSGWGPSIHTSDGRSPLLLLRPTWPGTEAPSDEPRFHLLRQLVTATPTSGPGSPRCPGLRCMRLPAPGTRSRREFSRCRHRHLAMQAIRHTRV